MRRPPGWIPWTVCLLALIWCVLIVAPPVMYARGLHSESTLLRLFFHPICHQIPARSFTLSGTPLAVCARCFGVYGGFWIGSLIALITSRRRPWNPTMPGRALFILAVLPSLLQWSLGHLGIIADIGLHRALLGSLIGGACVFYILPALHALWEEIAHCPDQRIPPEGTVHGTAT